MQDSTSYDVLANHACLFSILATDLTAIDDQPSRVSLCCFLDAQAAHAPFRGTRKYANHTIQHAPGSVVCPQI